MRRWIRDQIGDVATRVGQVTVVLDPEKLVSPGDASELEHAAELAVAVNWHELRRAYETQGRGRAPDAAPFVILVRAESFDDPRDLPFDIERSSRVARIRLPVAGAYTAVVRELSELQQDVAVQVLGVAAEDPLVNLVSRLWGVGLSNAAEAWELDAVGRLRTDPSVPPSLWKLIRPRLRSPLAQGLADQPPDASLLQSAWEDWLRIGDDSPHAPLFKSLRVRIAGLFHAGFLRPARASTELPTWTALGVVDASWTDRLGSLLDAAPSPWPPSDLAGWIKTAEWWGETRAALAQGAPETLDLSSTTWGRWEELDRAFRPWLRENMGSLMFSAARWPATVDKIAAFLARRLREGIAQRVLLVVLDGMAFSQWSALRRGASLSVIEGGGVIAMVPTLTSVSRQAIFAGMRPDGFSASIKTTSAEQTEWTNAWQQEGVPVPDVRYIGTDGRLPADVPDFGDAVVMGMVVNAVDESLHGAEVLGDAQLHASLDVWVRHGFLRTLVERATDQGFEVWLTADHGNLESLPLGRVVEGLAVEAAGVRQRWYRDPALRDRARADGEAWDPPGLPEGVIYPMFAEGRGGYFSGGVRVTHGGISLDEVIVPLVRVTP